VNATAVAVGALGAAVAGELVLDAHRPTQVAVPHVAGGNAYYAALLSRVRARYPHATNAAGAMRQELEGLRSRWGTMRVPGGVGVHDTTITAPLGEWLKVCDWWLQLGRGVSGAAVLLQHPAGTHAVTEGVQAFGVFVEGVPAGLRFVTVANGASHLSVDLAARAELELEHLAVALDEGRDAFAPAHPNDASYWEHVGNRAAAAAEDVGELAVGFATGAAEGALRTLAAPAGAALALLVIGYVVYRRRKAGGA